MTIKEKENLIKMFKARTCTYISCLDCAFHDSMDSRCRAGIGPLHDMELSRFRFCFPKLIELGLVTEEEVFLELL